MKLFSLQHFFIVCVCLPLFSLQAKKTESPKDILNQGISFKENLGQVSDQNHKARADVLFSGTTGNLTFHLKKDGISYQLSHVEHWKEEEDFKTKEKRKYADQYTIYRVDMNWLNVNSSPLIKKEGQSADYENYYLPTCPNGAIGVKSYNQITYQQLYNGIDLKWHEKNTTLKYDFLVAANADYKQIQLEIKGANSIKLSKSGELQIETPLGTIVEQAPLVIQLGKILRSKWVLNDNVVSFDIEEVNSSQPFVIDPGIRTWGSYYGAESDSRACITDKNGSVYMTGYTASGTPNIATTGAFQTIFAGSLDAFLVKFSPSGTRLWASYYGGSNDETGFSCAVDSTSNVYLFGSTNSYTDAVISTGGAHQVSFGNQGSSDKDAFLVKFNSAGIRQWATYYGGSGDEDAFYCTTDKVGNVFISGQTSSSNGTSMATNSSHQSSYGGGPLGTFDGYLAKFNSSGVRQWATYYGGIGQDMISSCITDASSNVYISGNTTTSAGTIIATPGSYQPLFTGSGNNGEIFLAKFSSSGTRQWGTYYGGSGSESCASSCMDNAGNIFLTGSSNSNTGITTLGAFQPTLLTTNDAFLSKFNNNGMLQWGTFYVGGCFASFCATNKLGDVYFVGSTTNSNGNVGTSGSCQINYGGGIEDAFIAKFTNSGTRLWGSYYGGTDFDNATACSTDNLGNIYFCGTSQSNGDTSIATPGSFLDSITSSYLYSCFLVKFKDTDFTPVGIYNESSFSLISKIYPNPAQDLITLVTDSTFLRTKTYKLNIINCLGQVCKEIISYNENSQINIDVSNLPNGMYTLTVAGNNILSPAGKFVIAK